jgi:hypothetical protein
LKDGEDEELRESRTRAKDCFPIRAESILFEEEEFIIGASSSPPLKRKISGDTI